MARPKKPKKPPPEPAQYGCCSGDGDLLFVVTFAGAELLIDWFRLPDEVSRVDKERGAAWLNRLLPNMTNDECFDFLWK